MKKNLLYGILFLLMLSFVTSCDETIHFYPEPQSSLIILQLNVDRDPPTLYKRVVYDEKWQSSTEELSGSDRAYTYPEDYLLRITIEIYRYYGDNSRTDIQDVDEYPTERRVLLLPSDAQMPQDTIHAYLPDGKYKALAFADYVPMDKASDWHYLTTDLRDITTNLNTYPRNPHLRSAAAGSASFSMTHQLTEGGYPATEEAANTPVWDRVIPVNLMRAHGRIRIYSSDWRQCYELQDDVSIKLLYKDYVTTGYSVWNEEPSDYITTYGYITRPPLGDYDPLFDSRLMVEDYLFAPSDREMIVHAVLISYDKYGNVIKTTPDIVIPIRRNQTTTIYAPNFTVGRDDDDGDAGLSVDESFDDEVVIII